MVKGGLRALTLASLVFSGVCAAGAADNSEKIYQERCANCHGAKADGVPRLTPYAGMSAKEAAAGGTASQEKWEIHGPALKGFDKETLLHKLIDLRNRDYDSESYHSVMKKNLSNIEKREGKIADEKMAEYIHGTFGGGGK